MACICPDLLCCFDGRPIDGDPRAQYTQKFKKNMLEAPSAEPMWFLYGCCPISMCCAQYSLRQGILGSDWPREYKCCQAYFNCPCCCKAGSCGESSCPELCLCLETLFCYSCALSANRALIMDKYNIIPGEFLYSLFFGFLEGEKD